MTFLETYRIVAIVTIAVIMIVVGLILMNKEETKDGK